MLLSLTLPQSVASAVICSRRYIRPVTAVPMRRSPHHQQKKSMLKEKSFDIWLNIILSVYRFFLTYLFLFGTLIVEPLIGVLSFCYLRIRMQLQKKKSELKEMLASLDQTLPVLASVSAILTPLFLWLMIVLGGLMISSPPFPIIHTQESNQRNRKLPSV